MHGFDWFLVMFITIRLWPYIRFLQLWPWNEQEKDLYNANKIGKYIYIKKYISKCKVHCTRNFYELFHMLLSGDVYIYTCIY